MLSTTKPLGARTIGDPLPCSGWHGSPLSRIWVSHGIEHTLGLVDGR